MPVRYCLGPRHDPVSPIASSVVYPLPPFDLLLSPVIAAAAMSFGSVSVVTNALRLRKVRFQLVGTAKRGIGYSGWRQ